MDYEHDDRRAADVPGATGAEGSGLPAGREPLDADLPSSRSPEVRAFDPHLGSSPGPSDLTASGQADDLFDAMFLTGGLRPPAFAAVDHDLGFPPPQAPDLASAFLAALDAIDDRRFVTPVPDEPLPSSAPPVESASPVESAAPWEAPAPVETAASVETAAGESAYELRPQSRLELEAEGTPESADETLAAPVAAEDAAQLPWDTARVPVAGLLTAGEIAGDFAGERATENEAARESADDTWAFASYLESESDLQARAAIASAASVPDAQTIEEAIGEPVGEPVHEAVKDETFKESFSGSFDGSEGSFEEPIEEAAYYAAGLDGDAGDADEVEAAAVVAAEAEAEIEAVAAAAGQADADAEAAAAATEAEAVAEAEALALALAEAEAQAAAEQAELEAAIAAEAALDDASNGAPVGSFAASAVSTGFSDGSDETVDEATEETVAAAFDASLEDDAFDMAFDAAGLDATSDVAALDAAPDADALASASGPDLSGLDLSGADLSGSDLSGTDLTPGDDDLELEPSIGIEPMDAAPMAFDGPDAFAPAPVAAVAPEPEPEPESDELEDLQDYVVFSLGDMRCVVPIRNVVEVGRIPDAAPVPNAPVWLYGLGNLRGQVLSLIDLRAFFGVGRIKAAAGRMVVLRGDSDDITAGVMVDQVHQIVALSPSRFKEAPAELPLPEKTTEFVWGACDYGNYTMIGLDVDGVLGVENLTEEAV